MQSHFYKPSLIFYQRKLLLIVLNGHYVEASSALHKIFEFGIFYV